MAFRPIEGSAKIEAQYKRYLTTMFRMNDPDYQEQFLRQINADHAFAKGPYLDAQDFFATGKTTGDLVRDGVLPAFFLKYRFHHDRPLYRHQEIALRKALNGKNIVVSTGTGSGKTESFLMPILAALAEEKEKGTLGKGVRALLIYPMNALANDQVERMRELLADTPEITFGCYTGQTKNEYNNALNEYIKLNKKKPLPNELISRAQMKETPPHLLITNYAMLEYLMVRPGDHALFQDDTWRFVVLDEAHVYRGSTGIEVSMLLRRLSATLKGTKLQFFLTSATLGDESENNEVASFAQHLCDSFFSSEDIIRAIRVPVPAPENPIHVPMGVYEEIQGKIEAGQDAEEIGRFLLKEYEPWLLNPAYALFDMVHRDERYWQIRNLLQKPCSVAQVAADTGMSSKEIDCFVYVASFCEANGIRLLDARYHTFLRATDSVFITLAPSKRLFLTRTKTYDDPADGNRYKVFEAAACSSCHAIYLNGAIDSKTHCIEQNNGFDGKDYFYLGNSLSLSDEDSQEDEGKYTPGTVCAICGHFKRDKVRNEPSCEHGAAYAVPVIQVKTKAPDHRVKKCVCCEAVNNYGVVRSFFTGQEAVTSVIATSLFEALPSQTTIKTPVEASDDFGFGFEDETEYTRDSSREEARQFLCFSDSRQASAYFATYLDRTYRSLLYRRCMTEQLKKMNRPVGLSDFCQDLAAIFEERHILKGTGFRHEKESWKAVLAEIGDANSDSSLFGMGMIQIGLPENSMPANPKLQMSAEEVTCLFNVLISSILNDLAIMIPVPMTEEDREFYAYGGAPVRYDCFSSESTNGVKSFIPKSSTRTNKRLEYLTRVLKEKAPDISGIEQARRLLEVLWNMLVKKDILTFQKDGFQIRHSALSIERPRQWYRCDKCHKLTTYNIADVCPTYQCDGTLHPANPEEELTDNHYFRLYHDMDIQPLRVKEHTAQLDRDQAYEYQQDFKDKKIDVLSCSTTFEMGVDVGSLETVFMRNMPPLPSNYAQRAGRAGRSRHSAAFALTFCNRSSHDFSFFEHPIDMIRGRIHAPHFTVENEKIAIRHLYASALAFFWRNDPKFFSTVEKMAEAAGTETGFTQFASYLRQHPADLREYLRAFLPASLYTRFDCEHFGWIEGLIGDTADDPGILTKAVEEYSHEVSILEQARQEAFDKHRNINAFDQRLRTYRTENILSFLSRRNVMPQYGFPVDTVALNVTSGKNNQVYGVELQRDLAMAISEYAPGSQIVANGEMFTGRYIKKVPKIGWKMYDYNVCTQCNTLNIDVHINDEANPNLQRCKMCGEPLKNENERTFIIPLFGFEIDPDLTKKPGLIRPEKTYRTDVYYVGYRQNMSTEEVRVGKTKAQVVFSEKDEMTLLNKSEFHVCEYCGYAEVGQGFMRYIPTSHNTSGGRKCSAKLLKKYSLGYRFETDVFQLSFPDLPLEMTEDGAAVSVLYALLRGIVNTLDLENDDISGCLQSIRENGTRSVAFIFYDTTPGGAGHVRRLQKHGVLAQAVETALRFMRNCTCGGQEGHASCYSCLRSYRNQKLHDILDRALAIEYLERII